MLLKLTALESKNVFNISRLQSNLALSRPNITVYNTTIGQIEIINMAMETRK